MKVFNQTWCNDKLDTEKNKVKKCKSFGMKFKSLFSHHVRMNSISNFLHKEGNKIFKETFKLGSSLKKRN